MNSDYFTFMTWHNEMLLWNTLKWPRHTSCTSVRRQFDSGVSFTLFNSRGICLIMTPKCQHPCRRFVCDNNLIHQYLWNIREANNLILIQANTGLLLKNTEKKNEVIIIICLFYIMFFFSHHNILIASAYWKPVLIIQNSLITVTHFFATNLKKIPVLTWMMMSRQIPAPISEGSPYMPVITYTMAWPIVMIIPNTETH